jgi:DNA polymerase III alpha subunit
MDIAQWVLDQCKVQAELQRVAQELFLFQERNLFPLLCYLKYLVDTMRKHGVVWGVGRGSSVASYVLFLIGVHKIDSLYYDLPIDEFLKETNEKII